MLTAVIVCVLTRSPLTSLQAAVYDTMTPFLPSSSGRDQVSVTFLEPSLVTEKEDGGAVGAVRTIDREISHNKMTTA